jgi:hypothetical protein
MQTGVQITGANSLLGSRQAWFGRSMRSEVGISAFLQVNRTGTRKKLSQAKTMYLFPRALFHIWTLARSGVPER